ncbi:MAG: glycoside hydrolase family 31 protein [Ignavibacteriae bacterium]|nr:MAG: glycoside hydrolase family 31 protein [Ignavibacteriota bacterium]
MKTTIRFLIILLCLSSARLSAQQDISWTSGRFKILSSNKTITVFDSTTPLVKIFSINFNFAAPKSMVLGKSTNLSLFLILTYPAETQYREQSEELSATIEISVLNNALRFRSSPEWASNVTIQLEDGGEHYFGILEPLYPNNQKSPDLRGEVVDVDVLGDGNWYHENYASTWSAFYMTNKGYASFFDSFSMGKYKLGINGKTELYHRTGQLDWYIIAGKDGDEIMRQYYEIIGKPKFVPMWGVGPIGWRDQNNGGKDEILSDIQHMTDLQIPFTGWFVDRPYSHGTHEWSKMDFAEKFANPKEWIGTIRTKYGMEFMTWVTSATFGDNDFPGMLPSQEGYFDLTNPEAMKEFKRRLTEFQYSVGVKGHKIDRADQLFPQMYPWYDKTPVYERRNKYVFLLSKTIDDFLREVHQDDQMNFARAAFHRCQPFLSAVWGGDSRSSWDGMAANLANAVRCSYMGFPVWGSDVGGYLSGRIPEDLYARWLQFGAWCAFYEIKIDDAGGKREDRVPWKYSQRLQNIFKDCNTQRMELQPYLYSLINTSFKNGVVMKPLAYVFPNDQNTYNLWNEYMLGNAFLIAPILDSTNSRTVYLPKGTWYDYYNTGKVYTGGQEFTVTQPLERIPVFIKMNSMYVTGMMLTGNSKLWNNKQNKKELNLFVYPGASGKNATFEYVDYYDMNKEKTFILESKERTVDISLPALSTDVLVSVRIEKKPVSVTINGKKVDFSWDPHLKKAVLRIGKNVSRTITVLR